MAKKRFKGTVVSNKMNKTVVVAVEMLKKHRIYGKLYKSTKRFKARTENEYKIGDVIVIEESRPYSKTVTWKVVED